jgi:hypothetical protein
MPKITEEQYESAMDVIRKYNEQQAEIQSKLQQKELRVYQTQERARDSRLDCTGVLG